MDYLTADDEDKYVIAQANEQLDEQGHFIADHVPVRVRDEFVEVPISEVDLENDDASRAIPFAPTRRGRQDLYARK